MNDTTARPEPPERRGGRRRNAARLGLLGLLGIGLGVGTLVVSTAAWTDQVVVANSVASGSADLEGSLDGTSWVDSADSGAIELVLPAITDLKPGQSRSFDLQLRNTGTLPAELVSAVASSGPLFAEPAPVTTTLTGLATSLGGGAADTATLTITAPAWTGAQHMAESGTVIVTITGTVP